MVTHESPEQRFLVHVVYSNVCMLHQRQAIMAEPGREHGYQSLFAHRNCAWGLAAANQLLATLPEHHRRRKWLLSTREELLKYLTT